MTKILVVDDEQDLCEILRFNLTAEGYDVTTANSAEEALILMDGKGEEPFALVLLDVMMENMSGFDMAREMREHGDNTPVIFLTARDSHDDQLEGFGCGADDYITKPFSFDTVLARVKAVLKRSQKATPAAVPPRRKAEALAIDTVNNLVLVEGKPVELTRREYMILCLMARQPGHFFTREEIMESVWPNDALVSDRSVDVHIARLRKKLGPEGRRLVNRTGFGYALQNN